LREDVGNLKEIIFDMSDEINRLKKEIEDLKAGSQ
jgi:archaellum component FlaC